jgi:hypothetical protein
MAPATTRLTYEFEELAAATPGPGLAQVTRDPSHNVPLKNNVRYRALVERLETEMRATKL